MVKKLSICLLILFVNSILFFVSKKSIALPQVIPDDTLGNHSSKVTEGIIKKIPSKIIGGGAVRGVNLFHSFSRFDIDNLQRVYFQNPKGIQNIIGRVKGSVSHINGTLGVVDENLGVTGNANLFIINPNGIIFGPNASLDVGGSFVATTANSIQFGNQGSFDASGNDSPPLLTVNPSGFVFFRENTSPAPIFNFSNKYAGTRVSLDPTLIDKNINLYGLKVPDGQSLLLLGGNVTIDNGGLYALGGEIGIISLAGPGFVGLASEEDKLGLNVSQGTARGDITFINHSRVDTSGNNSGGGKIEVIGKNIYLRGGSQIISETPVQRDGEKIILDATGTIEIKEFVPQGTVSTLATKSGNAGAIEIFAGNLIINEGGQIVTSTLSNGKGGDITITTTEGVELSETSPDGFFSGIFSATASTGSGGDITVETSNLIIRDGAQIFSGGGPIRLPDGSILETTGTGGDIVIKADKLVHINGGDAGIFADIFTQKGDKGGVAGNVNIETNILSIENGVVAVSSSKGKAGNISIIADSLFLNRGGLSANAALSGTNEAEVANINLTLSDSLIMKGESFISANASNRAKGGNIIINSPTLVALPSIGFNGSDIIATAKEGQGGNITINSQGIFGIKERTSFEGNRSNDIDASSEFGAPGQVDIDTTFDVSRGLIELPQTVVDANALLADNACRRSADSTFINSGRGGLPPSLSEDLNSNTSQVSLVEPALASSDNPQPKATEPPTTSLTSNSSTLVPAQGWVFNDKGEVVLVAYNSAVEGPQRLQTTSAGCPVQ